MAAAGYFNQDTGGTAVGAWTAAGNVEGYVGLELTQGSTTNYGWAHFIYDSAGTPPNNVDTGTLTLVDAAVESTPGLGILTGQTAEPAKPAVERSYQSPIENHGDGIPKDFPGPRYDRRSKYRNFHRGTL